MLVVVWRFLQDTHWHSCSLTLSPSLIPTQNHSWVPCCVVTAIMISSDVLCCEVSVLQTTQQFTDSESVNPKPKQMWLWHTTPKRPRIDQKWIWTSFSSQFWVTLGWYAFLFRACSKRVTIACLNFLGLERGGWELLPVCGCEIGRDRASQSYSLLQRGSYSGREVTAEIAQAFNRYKGATKDRHN